VKSLKVDSVPEMPLVVVLPKVAVQLKTCRKKSSFYFELKYSRTFF
jgi:hypothetical protein